MLNAPDSWLTVDDLAGVAQGRLCAMRLNGMNQLNVAEVGGLQWNLSEATWVGLLALTFLCNCGFEAKLNVFLLWMQ